MWQLKLNTKWIIKRNVISWRGFNLDDDDDDDYDDKADDDDDDDDDDVDDDDEEGGEAVPNYDSVEDGEKLVQVVNKGDIL